MKTDYNCNYKVLFYLTGSGSRIAVTHSLFSFIDAYTHTPHEHTLTLRALPCEHTRSQHVHIHMCIYTLTPHHQHMHIYTLTPHAHMHTLTPQEFICTLTLCSQTVVKIPKLKNRICKLLSPCLSRTADPFVVKCLCLTLDCLELQTRLL